MLYVRIAREGSETGNELKRLLRERDCRLATSDERATGTVCWGVGIGVAPNVLNGAVGELSKLGQLKAMFEAGVRVPPFKTPRRVYGEFETPAFARKAHHMRGQDLQVCLEPEEVTWRFNAGWDYATRWIPRRKEYRVWVWRNEKLATYTRELVRPNRFTGVGFAFDSGWDYVRCQERPPEDVIRQAIQAVQAVHYDFGAVDVLEARERGQAYVLEVNSAPGSFPAEGGLKLLADRIKTWSETLGV